MPAYSQIFKCTYIECYKEDPISEYIVHVHFLIPDFMNQSAAASLLVDCLFFKPGGGGAIRTVTYDLCSNHASLKRTTKLCVELILLVNHIQGH